MRIGSLFSGYGGLDLGVMEALGGTVAWHAEFEEAPSKILAHHWPNVPNLGDVTAVDWSAVEPVDIICGGSPCQDVSMAGARKGMRAGTRSGLWASMCDAIETIRPALVVWENVRGALSAGADSNVEPCPICVGDGPATHLRALGRVLGDLAELGYDAGWEVVRASDVGAPHRRERVFVVAWPTTDANSVGRCRRVGRAVSTHSTVPGTVGGVGALPDARRERLTYERMNRRSASDTDSPLDAAAAVMASHSASSTRMDRGRSPLRSAKGLHEVGGVHNRGERVLGARAVTVNDGEDVATPKKSGDGHAAAGHNVGVPLESGGAQVRGQVVRNVLVGGVLSVEFGLGDGVHRHVETVPRVNTACQYTMGPDLTLLPTPDAYSADRGGPQHPDKRRAGGHSVTIADAVSALLPTPRATDGTKGGPNQRGSSGDLMLPSAVQLLPTPSAADAMGGHERRGGARGGELLLKGIAKYELLPTPLVGSSSPASHGQISEQWRDAMAAALAHFGQYAPAIARWEAVTGRTAPAPTEPNAAGNQRLSARFVEWMMGLPEGHVVDVPGITRNQALKALGNGVVPQQAAHAIRRILAWTEVAA